MQSKCPVLASALTLVLASLACAQRAQNPSPAAKQLTSVELGDLARKVTVRITRADGGGGSGVWVSDQGYVATCWHVVEGTPGQIEVGMAQKPTVDKNGNAFDSIFQAWRVQIVARNEDADIAVLKTTLGSPFPGPLAPSFDDGKWTAPEIAVAQIADSIPDDGTHITLAGFPINGLHLIVQFGEIAGRGSQPYPGSPRGKRPLDFVRIYTSVMANPGDSGGPILNDLGQLVALTDAYMPSNIRDDHGVPVPLLGNSGISVGIPAGLVSELLKQAQARGASK